MEAPRVTEGMPIDTPAFDRTVPASSSRSTASRGEVAAPTALCRSHQSWSLPGQRDPAWLRRAVAGHDRLPRDHGSRLSPGPAHGEYKLLDFNPRMVLSSGSPK